MNSKFVVVDGSNIATEGRSSPSLVQLDEAVREFQQQFPDKQVIVVVDATFGHRIDSSERKAFDDAVAHGEIVSPPAGAVGRGDAFLLRIAERVTAQVLSNDSFQEFHTEHPWLFDEGRLIGGTPVPGVGWIFTPRTPVRSASNRATKSAPGPSPAKPASQKRSRTTTQAAPASEAPKPSKRVTAKKAARAEKEKKKAPAKNAAKAAKGSKQPVAKKAVKAVKAPKATATKAPKTTTGPSKAATKVVKAARKKASGPAASPVRRRPRAEVDAAIERATEEVLIPPDEAPPAPSRGRGRARQREAPSAVNDPVTFLEFVSEHPIGSRVEGKVSSFMSHGAMVDVGEMRCYVPLKGLGVPAPVRAREVLKRGESRTFVLVGLDVPRRGAELALPEVVTGEGTKR